MPHEGQVAEAWSIAHGRDEVGQDEPKVMQLSEVKIFRGTGTDYLVRDRVYHTLDGNDGKSISNMVREPCVNSVIGNLTPLNRGVSLLRVSHKIYLFL